MKLQLEKHRISKGNAWYGLILTRYEDRQRFPVKVGVSVSFGFGRVVRILQIFRLKGRLERKKK